MAAFKELLLDAFKQQHTLQAQLDSLRPDAEKAISDFESWRDGILLRHIFRSKYKRLTDNSVALAREVSELEADLSSSLVPLQLSMTAEQEAAYEVLCDAFSQLSMSAIIWDTLSQRAIDKRAERSVADQVVTRSRVSITLSATDFFAPPLKVPCMENRNGGHLYFYPGFILYLESRRSFALLSVPEVALELARVHFHEHETVPADTNVVGQTWLKANKDGSPDRRFSGNAAIPIVEYGQLSFKSSTGLNERYMVSSYSRSQLFDTAWESYRQLLRGAT